jgi:hypothetical protein
LVVKHSGIPARLHFEAFQGYSLIWDRPMPAPTPWIASCLGLSALISLGFFLLQLSSKCQNAVLAWFAGRVTRTFAQSYPQKLWGKRDGD